MAVPLSALLSQVLVALTVEIDNASESRAPHRTARYGGTGPWLTSYAMWANFLRLVPDDGISARALAEAAGWRSARHPAQAGMERWGYVSVSPDPDDRRPKPPPAAWIVRPTRAGQASRTIWATLPNEIEERWRHRLGAPAIEMVTGASGQIVSRIGRALPAYLPQLRPDLFTSAPALAPRPGDRTLVTVLSNVLQSFAIECEQGWPVGLAAVANIVRVLETVEVAERELPGRTGIAKEALRFATGVLDRHGCVHITTERASGRGRAIQLSTRGLALQTSYAERTAAVERDWSNRFGSAVTDLRSTLEAMVGAQGALLRSGMTPPPGAWRARTRTLAVLPHFPFVWHRGGYPDGA